MEVYKQPPYAFDSSGWKTEKNTNSKLAQNSIETLGNVDYISYDEIGPEDPDSMFGGLESEDGLIENIFTYEDDDNEIHVDYIAYDESESIPEIPKDSSPSEQQGGRDAESEKFLVPDLDFKLETSKTKNFFKKDKKRGKSKFPAKKKVVDDNGKERNPPRLISLAKKKKKKTTDASSTLSPAEDDSSTRPKKVDSTEVSESAAHKKWVNKLSKQLLRQFFQVPRGGMHQVNQVPPGVQVQVPPGVIQAEKGPGLGGNALHRVSTFVAELTNFATSYNKLASVLIQGQ